MTTGKNVNEIVAAYVTMESRSQIYSCLYAVGGSILVLRHRLGDLHSESYGSTKGSNRRLSRELDQRKGTVRT
jgi:hypothetical protein